jgi:uncharacterized membrane protein HdeD (DUF308 family)
MSQSAGAGPTDRFHLQAVAGSWVLALGYGALCLALGVALTVWPGETLAVVAVLVAIQLLVNGVMRVATALTSSGLDGGVRALLGLAGAISLVVGLLLLRDPVQSLLLVGLLVGVWFLLSGVVDLIATVLGPAGSLRGTGLASALVSILAGAFLMANPELTLGVLVLVVCIWLFAIGGMAVVAALGLRAAGRRAEAGAPTGPSSPVSTT